MDRKNSPLRVVYDFLPKKAKSKNKKSCDQKGHFKTRFQERVGVRCTEEIYQNLKSQINGKNPLHNNVPDRPIYLIDYLNMKLRIVYDKKTKSLVTVI